MRTACWNCRGLGNDSTVRRLKEIHKKYLLDIICLSETKQGNDLVRDVGAQLGFQNYVSVPPNGSSGGLVIFWNHNVQLSVLSQSPNLIDCKVSFNEVSSFYFTFVYGHPVSSLRHYTWERLDRWGINRRNKPWLLLGDWNEILGNHEKIGGRLRPAASFQTFRTLVRNLDLVDLKSVGNRFSWVGKRGDHHVQCCLDRTMANGEWLNDFPASETEFLEIGESDHRPLVTFVSHDIEEPRRLFRFDNRLCQKEGFKETISRGWKGSGQSQLMNLPLAQRLIKCRSQISTWKRLHRVNAEERIQLLRGKLDRAVCSAATTAQEKNLIMEDLNQAYVEEEMYWKQKSRVMWLRAGDRNTSYFHSITKARRNRMNLTFIQDDHGVIQRGHKNIAKVAEDYFQRLYSSTADPSTHFSKVFQGFQARVTDEVNTELIARVTEEEIQAAIFDIGGHRAPGPDGFSAIFYHNYWEEIKPDVISEIIQFFDNGNLDSRLNHTHLCLIPKVYPPTGMTEFRPIALCNVAYKIISKVLVNRLKKHLSGLITENQAAFIPGRMITDNIILAHEVFHSLKVRKRQSKSYMAVKTDITKAYDRLEWNFLEETMRRMGFHDKWITWIMKCISSVTFSVLINGSPEGFITPQRGIRQGDPLSPYLFILCAEVLSHLMNQAQFSRRLLGVKISNQAPAINHLLFADDSLFFSLANARSGTQLKKILGLYEQVSGQAINLTKSSITFGSKVSQGVKTQMRNILGIHNDGGMGKYLGLPEQFGRKKSEMFAYIIDKVKKVTQGWHQRYLSHGGKEVLLKAIALAMPIYSMNVFRLTKEICEEINGILARFWWSSGDKKSIHWFSWDRICLPKKEGGLGFRDLANFNQALLGKQVWRIMQHPECLMARVLKARYFPDGNILTAVLKKKASYAWKSLLHGRDLVKQGLRVIIGNGSTVSTWIDPWIPCHPPRPPRSNGNGFGFSTVDQLLTTDGSRWDENKLRMVIVDEDVQKILNLKVSSRANLDLLGWQYNGDGLYSVKSGYWLSTHLPTNPIIQLIPGNTLLKQKIWKTRIPSKLQHFLWKMTSQSLATSYNLKRRHIINDAQCKRCCQGEETEQHIFFDCTYAKAMWRASGVSNLIINSSTTSFEEKIEECIRCSASTTLTHLHDLPIWILWRLWKSRNLLIFQTKHVPWRVLLQQAKKDAKEWRDNNVHTQELTPGQQSNVNHSRRKIWKRPRA